MEPDLGFLVDRTKQGVSMAYRRLCGKPTSQKSFYPRENDVGKRYDNDFLFQWPRESNGYAYILNGGWSYTQKQTTFSINAEGGYAGLKRKGDLEYTEERSANGEQFENGEFKSLDDFDIHETFGLGNLAVDHKFNDKGHNLAVASS